MFGGFGADTEPTRRRTRARARSGARVEAALEADRRRRLRAHRLAAERAGDVAGVDLDPVGELEQPPQRVEEALGALLRADGEVGSGGVADEERVAGEDEPGLVGAVRSMTARQVCSGRCPGVWIARRTTVAELDLGAVLERRRGRYSASAAGWIETGTPCSSASRPCPERWSACVCVSTCADDLDAAPRGASSSTGSIAYGGSTIAATPASSSPTRYDAQPRSSSRNCSNSTKRDAIRLCGARRAARRRRRRPPSVPTAAPARESRSLAPPGHDRERVLDLDRLAVRVDGAEHERQTPGSGRPPPDPRGPLRLGRTTPGAGSKGLEPRPLDLEPFGRRPGRSWGSSIRSSVTAPCSTRRGWTSTWADAGSADRATRASLSLRARIKRKGPPIHRFGMGIPGKNPLGVLTRRCTMHTNGRTHHMRTKNPLAVAGAARLEPRAGRGRLRRRRRRRRVGTGAATGEGAATRPPSR